MVNTRANWVGMAAGLIALFVMPLVSLAQEAPADVPQRERRPQRGLFGPRNPPAGESQSLNLTLVLYGVYDDNFTGDDNVTGEVAEPSSIDPRFQESGYRTGLYANLAYQRRWDRASVAATGGSAAAYYPGVSDGILASHNASLGVTAPLGRRTTLSGTQTASYAPFSYNLFPAFPGPEPGGARQSRCRASTIRFRIATS